MSDYVDAIRAELERVGVDSYEFQHGGKHPRVVWTHQGRSRFYVFPATPSDSRRGILNMLSDLRRELGASAPAKPKSATPKRKPRVVVRLGEMQPPDLSTFARPDPLLALAAWKPPSRFRWIRGSGPTWRVEVLREPYARIIAQQQLLS